MRGIDSLRAAERLDTGILRTFLAVAETGSITSGADRIFRSQSAASLQIQRLEGLLGQPVFLRHGRGVVLTAAGERLRPVAQRVVRLLDEALADLRSDRMEGSLRVGIPDEYGEIILPKVLASFSRDHPRVELFVQCALSASFPTALERGQLDMAVHDVDVPRQGQQMLRRQGTAWVTSRNHLAHEQDPVPIALFDRDCWWRDQAIEALRQAGKEYRIAYSSESVTGVVAAIEAGIAIGLLATDSLPDDFIQLSEADGFPAMPDSVLVLNFRSGVDTTLAEAMSNAIRAAFNS